MSIYVYVPFVSTPISWDLIHTSKDFEKNRDVKKVTFYGDERGFKLNTMRQGDALWIVAHCNQGLDRIFPHAHSGMSADELVENIFDVAKAPGTLELIALCACKAGASGGSSSTVSFKQCLETALRKKHPKTQVAASPAKLSTPDPVGGRTFQNTGNKRAAIVQWVPTSGGSGASASTRGVGSGARPGQRS